MKKRVLYFDFLKAIAIIFVILIHVISEYWETLDVNSNTFIVLSFLDSISRFCVPIYFMVSGSLFLNEEKNITIKDVLKKYVPRILLLFIFWNISYNVLNIIVTKQVISLKVISNIFIDTIFGKGIFHLYFLPIIIGFYLCLPALRQITKKENKNIIKYLIIILFIFFGFSRIFNYLFNISLSYTIVFSKYLIYFLLGYYLNTFEISKKNTKMIYMIGFVGFIITFAMTVICSKTNGITDVFFKYDTFNVIIYSTAIFLFVKNNIVKFNDKLLKILSQTNFGVYLIHGLVLGLLEFIGLFSKIDNISITLSIIVNSILIYLISTLSIYILIKIPFIKKLVSL